MPKTSKALPDGGGEATTVEVGILNLQVIMAQEGDMWVAQAIEFDYAAGGESLEDVKARFEDGLCATIQDNLNLYGNLNTLLSTKPAPEYSLDLLMDQSLTRLIFDHKGEYTFSRKISAAAAPFFPYGEIAYFGPKSAQSVASA